MLEIELAFQKEGLLSLKREGFDPPNHLLATRPVICPTTPQML